MKRIAAIVLVGILLPCCGGSGTSSGGLPFNLIRPFWEFIHREPTSTHLRAVRFGDTNTGWIAGLQSTLLRTEDGGVTWTLQEHNPRNRGGDIDALDILDIFNAQAVGTDGGAGGRWWSTFDGGNIWNTLDVASTGFGPFTGVDLININLGISLTSDGTIRRVSAGVEFLFSVGTPGTYNDLQFPTDGVTGYVCGNGGVIFKSTTSGSSWLAQTTTITDDLHALWFPVDSSTGFACGAAGRILKTTDGGATPWTVTTPTAVTLRSIHFPGQATLGWACGDGGTILRTPGGGTSWVPQSSTVSVALYGIWFVDTLTGYCVGDLGTVLKTTDGGTTWVNLSTGSTSAAFKAVAFESTATTGYAVGDTGVIRMTADGGDTFAVQDFGATDLRSVTVPTDGTVAYACGPGGLIIKTSNSGALWATQTTPTTEDLNRIYFPASDCIGFAVGNMGVILKTINGGTTWTDISPASTADLHDIYAPGSGLTTYVCGDAGTILKTDNFGATWAPIAFPDIILILQIDVPNDTIIYAGAVNGSLYRSVDSGTSYSVLPTGTSLDGMMFSSLDDGLFVNGLIRTTANGGTTITTSPDHSIFLMRDVWISADGMTGYVVGDSGTILKTTTGGK